jgi:hypothetical protein
MLPPGLGGARGARRRGETRGSKAERYANDKEDQSIEARQPKSDREEVPEVEVVVAASAVASAAASASASASASVVTVAVVVTLAAAAAEGRGRVGVGGGRKRVISGLVSEREEATATATATATTASVALAFVVGTTTGIGGGFAVPRSFAPYVIFRVDAFFPRPPALAHEQCAVLLIVTSSLLVPPFVVAVLALSYSLIIWRARDCWRRDIGRRMGGGDEMAGRHYVIRRSHRKLNQNHRLFGRPFIGNQRARNSLRARTFART